MQQQDIFNFKSHHRLKHINILRTMKKKILKYYFKLLKSLCKSNYLLIHVKYRRLLSRHVAIFINSHYFVE
jgi:hypothetical protein